MSRLNNTSASQVARGTSCRRILWAGSRLWCSSRPVDDYHFVTMRHWSLHESMMHSPYVATRLKTWHDRGRKRLEELIARMGFPLQHAKAQYGGPQCPSFACCDHPCRPCCSCFRHQHAFKFRHQQAFRYAGIGWLIIPA